MSIYVEILVRASMDALWAHTQMPALHERWDLRFSRIDYLPRAPAAGESVPSKAQNAIATGRGHRRRSHEEGCRGAAVKRRKLN